MLELSYGEYLGAGQEDFIRACMIENIFNFVLHFAS